MALMTESSANFNFSDFRTATKRDRCAYSKRYVKHQVHRRERREQANIIREQMAVLDAEAEVQRLAKDSRVLSAFLVDGKYKRTNPTEAELLHELDRELRMYEDHEFTMFNIMVDEFHDIFEGDEEYDGGDYADPYPYHGYY